MWSRADWKSLLGSIWTAESEQRYSAWGSSRYTSGAAPTKEKYTGQLEAETGLYFYNARWYDPALGRFISPDSIVPDKGNPLGLDRYAYVANNPISRIDTNGHCWGIASGIRGLPSYDTTCNNLDMALTIVQSDQVSAGEKLVAGAYIAAEGTSHLTLVSGGTMLACSAIAPCVKAAESALGIGGAACADGDCTNEAQVVGNALNAIRNMVGNAKGTAYEKWVQRLSGAEYDNKIGNLLMEAKASNWINFARGSDRYMQFQN
ncbi:MAG: RHS repeat-associated core domain-containing protein [Bacteroidales bacterium]